LTIDQLDVHAHLLGQPELTTVVYDHESGGGEHCQVGAPSLCQATFFDWVTAKFG
jgi:hypothetical protein